MVGADSSLFTLHSLVLILPVLCPCPHHLHHPHSTARPSVCVLPNKPTHNTTSERYPTNPRRAGRLSPGVAGTQAGNRCANLIRGGRRGSVGFSTCLRGFDRDVLDVQRRRRGGTATTRGLARRGEGYGGDLCGCKGCLRPYVLLPVSDAYGSSVPATHSTAQFVRNLLCFQ